MDGILWTVVLMAAVGLVGSVLLSIVSRKLAIGEDERLAYLARILPGANCGSCGHPGCEQYARALLAGAEPNACTVGGDRVAVELAAFLGVEPVGVVRRAAYVACKGSRDKIDPAFEFQGVPSCRVFSTMSYTSLSCPFGCLGFGDCREACAFDAISVKDGIASIDATACTGCGACVDLCPRHVIKLVGEGEASIAAYVACMNTMGGRRTRGVCSAGCIGCSKCVKACPTGAISVEHGLARVEAGACTGCGACIEACPTGALGALSFS